MVPDAVPSVITRPVGATSPETAIYETAFSLVMNRNRTQRKSTELRHDGIPDSASSDQQLQYKFFKGQYRAMALKDQELKRLGFVIIITV